MAILLTWALPARGTAERRIGWSDGRPPSVTTSTGTLGSSSAARANSAIVSNPMQLSWANLKVMLPVLVM